MEALAWSDYLCPWAYLGTDRTRALEALGVTVATLPYDLHPELPPQGRPLPHGARLASVYAHIAEQCADCGLPFSIPTRVPNTRLALQAAELVRVQHPDRFASVHAALFAAVFVNDDDIGRPEVLCEVITTTGLDGSALVDAAVADAAWPAVRASTESAIGRGVTGTPAWLLDGRLLIPGVQPRAAMQNWVSRLRERPASSPG